MNLFSDNNLTEVKQTSVSCPWNLKDFSRFFFSYLCRWKVAVWLPCCKLEEAKKAYSKIQKMALQIVEEWTRAASLLACETFISFFLYTCRLGKDLSKQLDFYGAKAYMTDEWTESWSSSWDTPKNALELRFGVKKVDSEVSAILIFTQPILWSSRSALKLWYKNTTEKNLWELEISTWLDQGRNYNAEASEGAIKGLLLVLGH